MRLSVTAVTALSLFALTACGASEDHPRSDTSPTPRGVRVSSVTLADSPLGRILVDDQGHTLYGFTEDKPGASECDSRCIAVWPALTSTKEITAGPGTRTELLRETAPGEGVRQATYGDWPLYYYVGDVTAGDVNGQGLDGKWFVVGADGKLLRNGA